jgi:HSP20 family protein
LVIQAKATSGVPASAERAKEVTMAQEIKKQENGNVSAPSYRDPFAAMRAEMDRLFDNFVGRGLFGRAGLPKAAATDVAIPDVDVHENDKEIVFEADLPGIDEKNVAITLRDGILSLKGEKKSERDEKKGTYHLTERSYGSFERSFQLPDTIDEEHIKADFAKGVLRVVVPKRPDAVKAAKSIPIGKS